MKIPFKKLQNFLIDEKFEKKETIGNSLVGYEPPSKLGQFTSPFYFPLNENSPDYEKTMESILEVVARLYGIHPAVLKAKILGVEMFFGESFSFKNSYRFIINLGSSFEGVEILEFSFEEFEIEIVKDIWLVLKEMIGLDTCLYYKNEVFLKYLKDSWFGREKDNSTYPLIKFDLFYYDAQSKSYPVTFGK